MNNDTAPSIGQVIARKRLRRNKMTQADLAVAAGVSIDLIRKLEQGQRHTLSMPSLHAIARALDVDAGELLGRPTALADPGPHSGAVAIRRALTSVDDLIGDEDPVEAFTLDEGRRLVGYAWAGYWSGHYDALGRLLPSAVAQAQATVRSARTADRPEAHDLAAQVYQVAACTLVHLGYGDIAHLALREALRLAEHGHDPLRPTVLRGSLAWVLLTQGRWNESQNLAVNSAAKVDTGASDATSLAVRGSLTLSAATAAARAGRTSAARSLLAEAGEVAARTGDRTDYETAFGPDQHLMQSIDIDVVTEDYDAAIVDAQRMPVTSSLPLAARCRHLSDVALAHTRLGHDGDALTTLERIERAAPTWLSFQAQPRQIVGELRHRAANPPRLTALAERMGLLNPA